MDVLHSAHGIQDQQGRQLQLIALIFPVLKPRSRGLRHLCVRPPVDHIHHTVSAPDAKPSVKGLIRIADNIKRQRILLKLRRYGLPVRLQRHQDLSARGGQPVVILGQLVDIQLTQRTAIVPQKKDRRLRRPASCLTQGPALLKRRIKDKVRQNLTCLYLTSIALHPGKSPVEHIVVQTLKGLPHPGKRQRQVHADGIRLHKHSAVLPGHAHVPSRL